MMMDRDILAMLTPAEIPAGSYDPNDVLLCDEVSVLEHDIALASHVIVGCPQDIGVKRNHGRPGARNAPAAIRQALYKLKPASESGEVFLMDLGDVDTSGDLEDIHDRLEGVITELMKLGKTVISLGGGNDISFPDASGVQAEYPDFVAMNVDAHLDMRKSDRRHSGTPYRNLVDTGKITPDNLYEVGITTWANSPRYLADARNMGVNIHTLQSIEKDGYARFFKDLFSGIKGRPLFAGLDMDCVRASDAPGVSASSPVGLSAKAVLDFADRCRRHEHTKVFEITEVNPEFDIDGRTAKLAALAIYAFIYGNK